MKNLYNAMVLFLIVITITTLFLCTHSNNDHEISIVADDNPSTQQMEIIKLVQADNRPVQTGRFKLEDGKILKLLRAGTNMSNIEIDQPCGLFDWCRNDLYCDGLFDGRCKAADYILPTEDQEISMVVDDNLSIQQIMEIIKASDNNGTVQTGLFKLEDGTSVKLFRARNGSENCINVGQPCGMLHWCCGDLHCDGYFDGICRAPDYCASSGGTCDGIHGVKCCKNLLCDFPISGTCRPLDYCLPLGSSCGTSIFPCCPGSLCVLVPVVLKAMCIF